MRHALAAVGVASMMLIGSADAALADTGVGLPLVAPTSATVPPPGFSSSANDAISAAEHTSTMSALHRREHPLDVQAFIWAGRRWYVDFSYRGRLVAEVDVAPNGGVAATWTGPQARALYTRGHFAPLFGSPWVLVPFSLLFALPFLDRRRLRRLLHLDAAVLLSLLVSYLLFTHAHLEAAVWLAYPPLIYLLVRMLVLGRGSRGGCRGAWSAAPAIPERALWLGLLLLCGARIGLSLAHGGVIDVGYASVIGAHRIEHGQSIYYAAAAHSDTYGPVMYLAYLPFELIFPWHGAWDYLAAAHAAALIFDLVTVAGLVVLGRRLRPSVHGRRLGLLLAWAWAACPFTLLGLVMHTNDGLIAMLAVLSLLAFSSPAGRGALLGLAAAAKFFPALLLPLYAAGRGRHRREALMCAAACAAVLIIAVLSFLPPGGLKELYDHTIAYQLHRADVFSIWSLHPGLAPLKVVIEAAALALTVLVAVIPGRRSLVQICALAGAVTIALQLPSTHWFYYYTVWFLPYVLVALLGSAPASDPPQPGEMDAQATAGAHRAAPARALSAA